MFVFLFDVHNIPYPYNMIGSGGAVASDEDEEDEEYDDGVDEEFITSDIPDCDEFECIPCMVCNLTYSTKSDDMLFCEGENCGKGLHQSCATPKIKKGDIPLGKWYCPHCEGRYYYFVTLLP